MTDKRQVLGQVWLQTANGKIHRRLEFGALGRAILEETEALVCGSGTEGDEMPRLPGEQRMLAGGHEGRKERGTEPQGTHRQQSQRKCELERESQGGRGHQCHLLLRNWADKA